MYYYKIHLIHSCSLSHVRAHTRACIVHTLTQLAAVKSECQREMEMLLGNLRELKREVQLNTLIIDNFVPTEFQVQEVYCDICNFGKT